MESNRLIFDEHGESLYAYNNVPYALINSELDDANSSVQKEFSEIERYYNVYRNGAKFFTEGSNGDYTPATLRYKMASSLIRKQARFMFGESPDIVVEAKGDLGKATKETKEALIVMNDLVKTVLDRNLFEDALLKAAKDCFIGKRVAGVVNFNKEDGITVSFLKSTQFLYETKSNNSLVLIKFVAFVILNDTVDAKERRILKKKYTLEEDGYVYIEEEIYNGSGSLIEVAAEKFKTKLTRIPAVIFINDGLTGEVKGESEISQVGEFEAWYSRLANGDIDAQRKSMNPTKYAIDMDSRSTANLSTGAGAFWDLGTDQNLENARPSVGMLEPNMSYSDALKTSLDRIKTAGYEQVDMPNVTLETMQGAMTSGKSLKAIYWGLLVRCKEKMKMWGPCLMQLVDILIQGSLVYQECTKKYIDSALMPVAYEISVEQNSPLSEDELDERNMDLAEVQAQTMSKKAYMIKWRGLTDTEAIEEINQIALERQMLEDAAFLEDGLI
jgi:hypothetical protein|nr:MAG TPA: PORTAL PROTEIN [Caudoviricetes sp.]